MSTASVGDSLMDSDSHRSSEPTRREQSEFARTQDMSVNVDEPEAFISKRELDNALEGFSAILPPVFFTMILSAATVLYVTPDAKETFAQSNLLLFNENDATSNQEAASLGLQNALIIIGVITGMTFLIVGLLYFHCEIIFAIYLFLALVMLMGFTTGVMVVEGLRYYLVPTDVITLGIFFYNYAIVGALAIFSYEVGFQGKERIIPYFLTQFYLVIISVVMSWLVTSLFPDFTVWALLVCLALYDLCAVLTPCGPLNLLIKVVTARGEAEERVRRENGEPEGDQGQRQMIPGLLYEVNTGPPRRRNKNKNNATGAGAAGILAFVAGISTEQSEDNEDKMVGSNKIGKESLNLLEIGDNVNKDTTSTTKPINEEAAASSVVRGDSEDDERSDAREELNRTLPKKTSSLQASSTRASNPQMYAEQPPNQKQNQVEEVVYEPEGSNLKLGLGDFVFYSVLTAKSAEYGFIAFISVACCVLCGLCGTLVLLSVFQKALPALPISIALGVATYIVAFKFISPFSDDLALLSISI